MIGALLMVESNHHDVLGVAFHPASIRGLTCCDCHFGGRSSVEVLVYTDIPMTTIVAAHNSVYTERGRGRPRDRGSEWVT